MVGPRIHILKSDGSIACKLKFKYDYEQVIDVDPDMICFRCLDVENIKLIDKKETLRAFLVRTIRPTMEHCDPERAIDLMFEICSELADQMKNHDVKCNFLVESVYCNNFVGRIVFEGKRYMYLKINYKPKRKERIKFEVSARDYLLLPVMQAFE